MVRVPQNEVIAGQARQFFDYLARGAPHGPDDGTLAPWVAVASLPFAPEIVLPAIDYCRHQAHLAEFDHYGFKASFNPTFKTHDSDQMGWVSNWHYGINQGPIVMMIENQATGLIWRLMRDNSSVVDGLRRAGFGEGWLDCA